MTELELDALFYDAARKMDDLVARLGPFDERELVYLIPDVLFYDLAKRYEVVTTYITEFSFMGERVVAEASLYGHQVLFIETTPFDEIEIIPAIMGSEYTYPCYEDTYVVTQDGVFKTEHVRRTEMGSVMSVSRHKAYNISSDFTVRPQRVNTRPCDLEESYDTSEINKYLSKLTVTTEGVI